MTYREKLIAFQNNAERAYAEQKNLKTTIRYVAAFIVFISSTLYAQVTLPFRLLRKAIVKGEENPGIIRMNAENIDVILDREPLVLIDFWAEWCGPCLMMEPALEQFATDHPEVCVAKVNADVNQAIMKRFNIRGLPQFVLIRRGMEVKRHAGPMTMNELQRFCETVKVPT